MTNCIQISKHTAGCRFPGFTLTPSICPPNIDQIQEVFKQKSMVRGRLFIVTAIGPDLFRQFLIDNFQPLSQPGTCLPVSEPCPKERRNVDDSRTSFRILVSKWRDKAKPTTYGISPRPSSRCQSLANRASSVQQKETGEFVRIILPFATMSKFAFGSVTHWGQAPEKLRLAIEEPARERVVPLVTCAPHNRPTPRGTCPGSVFERRQRRE